ncbi:MAG: hypothetical protein IJ667_06475 [Synergistaceae bacterium]|nr:hypothetical protein [Synergistaceae bacterium]
MAQLRDVLYRYREQYAGTLENFNAALKLKGKWFETICWYFFKNDPLYKRRFSDVWPEPGRQSGDVAYKRGLNTNIHMAVDAAGKPVRFIVTSGTTSLYCLIH